MNDVGNLIRKLGSFTKVACSKGFVDRACNSGKTDSTNRSFKAEDTQRQRDKERTYEKLTVCHRFTRQAQGTADLDVQVRGVSSEWLSHGQRRSAPEQGANGPSTTVGFDN